MRVSTATDRGDFFRACSTADVMRSRLVRVEIYRGRDERVRVQDGREHDGGRHDGEEELRTVHGRCADGGGCERGREMPRGRKERDRLNARTRLEGSRKLFEERGENYKLRGRNVERSWW